MNARTEWLNARRTGIGGSDIGAILGLSPYRSPLDVYLDKRGEIADTAENEAMYWGTVLEDVVAREYARRTGNKVQRINQMLRHPEHAFAIGNIDRAVVNPAISGTVRVRDGRITTDRILECKTANARMADQWGEPGSDYVPDTYLLQVQWYMAVTSTRFADLAVLIGGSDYRNYTIARDDGLIDDMLAEAEAFWRLVQSGTPPAPRSADDARRLWPQHVAAKKAVVGIDIAGACADLLALKDERDEIDARIEAKRLQVMTAMGDAEVAEYEGIAIATWKSAKPGVRQDWKAVAEDLADYVAEPVRAKIVAAHTTEVPGSRRFLLKNPKGQDQ